MLLVLVSHSIPKHLGPSCVATFFCGLCLYNIFFTICFIITEYCEVLSQFLVCNGMSPLWDYVKTLYLTQKLICNGEVSHVIN